VHNRRCEEVVVVVVVVGGGDGDGDGGGGVIVGNGHDICVVAIHFLFPNPKIPKLSKLSLQTP